MTARRSLVWPIVATMRRRVALMGKMASGPRVLSHEGADELRDLIRRCVEREVARIEAMHFGLWHLLAVAFRLAEVE